MRAQDGRPNFEWGKHMPGRLRVRIDQKIRRHEDRAEARDGWTEDEDGMVYGSESEWPIYRAPRA